MIRKPSRLLLAFLLLLVFAFLSVNVLLNFTPLRENITSPLEDGSDLRVKVGYLFINWKFQPVLQNMTIESTSPVPSVNQTEKTNLDQIILDFNWQTFWNDPTAPLDRYVEHISVRSLRRIERLGGNWDESNQWMIPVPVHIDRWEVLLHQNQGEILQVAGRDLRYDGPEDPIRSRIREYQHQPAEGTLEFSFDQGRLSAGASIESMSFSNDIWELGDDRWAGTIQFEQKGTHPFLTVDLRGTPGKMGGRQLPEMSVSSEVELRQNQYDVRRLDIESQFFQSRAEGSIDPSRDDISLEGDYDIPLPEMFDSVLSRQFEWIRDVSSSDLQGTYTVGGTMRDPDLSGDMNLLSSQFTLETSGGTSVAELRNVTGRLSDDRLELLSGELREQTKIFTVDSGFLEIEEGQVTFSTTGPLTMNPAGSSPDAFYPGPGESIRKLEDVKVRMSVTSTFGPGSRETALALKNGTFRFGPGQFRDLRGVLSHSSRGTDQNTLEASLRDPDGNEWRLSGPIRGPYQLQGYPRSLNQWLTYLIPDLSVNRSVSLRKTPVRATLRSVDNFADNTVEVRTEEDARITIDGRRMSLKGEIQGDSNGIRFRSVEAVSDQGVFNVDGTLDPDTPFEQSTLDLNLASERFPVTSWIQSYYETVTAARLTGELELDGTIRTPQPRGTIQFDELDYGFLSFRELQADVERKSDTTVFSEISGALNDGQVRGDLRLGDSRSLDLTADVVALDLPLLFSGGSWANRHVGGSITGTARLQGRIGDPDSFNGQLDGTVRGLMLDYFPRIEGIEKVARPEVLKNPILIEPTDFSFPIRNGVIQVNNLNLKSSGLRLETDGEVGFEGDLGLSMKLVLLDEAMKGFIQDVLGDLYRRVGIGGDGRKLTIPLRVKGPIESPNITVDHSEVNTNFRKNLVESLLSRPVGKPINEILDEILRTD